MHTFLINRAFPDKRADLLYRGDGIGNGTDGGRNGKVWGAIINFTTAAYLVDK